ncbi:MAG: BBE domain-containing protein [Actinomycetota bacterium]
MTLFVQRDLAFYHRDVLGGGTNGAPANCGATNERLVEIKRKYEPENLFHMNQNIKAS